VRAVAALEMKVQFEITTSGVDCGFVQGECTSSAPQDPEARNFAGNMAKGHASLRLADMAAPVARYPYGARLAMRSHIMPILSCKDPYSPRPLDVITFRYSQ
jgi:hypothetical protein